MNGFIDFLKLIPPQVQVVIASLVLGAAVVYAAESRYVTMDRFQKAYILDLKKIIREIEYILRDEVLTDRERRDDRQVKSNLTVRRQSLPTFGSRSVDR